MMQLGDAATIALGFVAALGGVIGALWRVVRHLDRKQYEGDAAIWKELNRLRAEMGEVRSTAITQATLDRAVERLERGMHEGFESLRGDIGYLRSRVDGLANGRGGDARGHR